MKFVKFIREGTARWAKMINDASIRVEALPAQEVAESSLAAAVLVQLGSLAPNLNWGISVTNHYLAEDLTDTPMRIEHGAIHRPRGAGLGIDVEEAQVMRFRVH